MTEFFEQDAGIFPRLHRNRGYSATLGEGEGEGEGGRDRRPVELAAALRQRAT